MVVWMVWVLQEVDFHCHDTLLESTWYFLSESGHRRNPDVLWKGLIVVPCKYSGNQVSFSLQRNITKHMQLEKRNSGKMVQEKERLVV